MTVDFTTVTETPGDQITRDAASMLVTRYEQAAILGAGRDVLELGCGSGQGLGYVASRARRVVGGDCTQSLLGIARQQYNGRIPLVRLDAQCLPFASFTFDVVALYEAIYYLPRPEAFVAECRRVLRDGGSLVISSVNREWPDFNPSPYSHWYPAAQDISEMLGRMFAKVEVYGAFPAVHRSTRGQVIALLKRTAVRMGVIPKTMRGKRLLKRLFYRELVTVPSQVGTDLAPPEPLVRLDARESHPEFKILFAIASS